LGIVFAGTMIGSLPGAPLLKKTPADKAVDRALEFLANTQNKTDGSWTAGRQGKSVAITSLAVMSFLSAGHVPGEGTYGKTIERGVRWVLTMQQPNGLLATDGGQEMYHHGIATLMLAEVCGMVNKELSKEVRRALEKAIAVILKAQRTAGTQGGGWRYRIAHVGGSDISVTGWQIMALRAAKNLGCDVPSETIERAVAYIKRCQDSRTGGFRYMPGWAVTVACTGTSILALELCGKDQHKSDAVMRGVSYLIRNENLPRWGGSHFSYNIYYGAQATFQVGSNYWSTYRTRLHQVLLRNQASNGSWPGNGYDSDYGPNYTTSMAVLALTVEYRFLPIYQRGEDSQ
jgi:squalene cyclase